MQSRRPTYRHTGIRPQVHWCEGIGVPQVHWCATTISALSRGRSHLRQWINVAEECCSRWQYEKGRVFSFRYGRHGLPTFRRTMACACTFQNHEMPRRHRREDSSIDGNPWRRESLEDLPVLILSVTKALRWFACLVNAVGGLHVPAHVCKLNWDNGRICLRSGCLEAEARNFYKS